MHLMRFAEAEIRKKNHWGDVIRKAICRA